MRKLKYHENKLLKKVNFYDWKSEQEHRQSAVIHRYRLQQREDYHQYNKICGLITSLISRLKQLPPDDAFRLQITEQVLEKLYNLGVTTTRENVIAAQKIPVSAFCRRRLAVLMQQLKFAETLKQATTYIQQGHVRIGSQVVRDPAVLVTKQMQDHIGWVDGSSIRQKILTYKQKMDDYDVRN